MFEYDPSGHDVATGHYLCHSALNTINGYYG